MNASIKTIKKLMAKEIASHYSTACQNCHSSIQRSFIHHGYHDVIMPMLENAQTEEDLEGVLSAMDYGMSLKEWIESL